MSLAKTFIYFVIYTVFLISVDCDSDLQCYVCTDCEFNYEGTATTCEDIQLNTVPPVVSTTKTGGTYTTSDGNMITDETTQPTGTTDSSTTEETACTEIPETTTHVIALTTDDPSNPKPTTTNPPFKLITKTSQPIETSSSTLSTIATNTEYISTETTTDLSTSEVSSTISILLSTTEVSDMTTGSDTKTSPQTEGQESTILPVITSTLPETEIVISTTELGVTTSQGSNSVTEINNSKYDGPIKIDYEDKQSQSPSSTETSTETSTNITSTFSAVLGSTTDFVTPYETLPTSTTDALSTTYMDTSTETDLEAKGPETSTLPTTTHPSSQTGPTLSSIGVSSTTEESTTESTTNSDIVSTMGQSLLDNEPNVMMIDDTKKYGARYRLIRAVKAKQNAGPRCIVTAYQEQNRTIVMRGCSFGEEDQDCNSVLDGRVKINNSKCFVCNTNLCNSASTSILSAFILIATMFIFI